MLSSPLTMIYPVKGLLLTIYLTFTNRSTISLLAQKVEELEHPVYYLSSSV